MSESETRPSTPADVARALRQEARFGCCVCGLPIFQYHHIVPWEQEHHFRVEDMMVLCPNHHDRARRAMPEEEQRAYKAAPYNQQQGFAHGMLYINQPTCAVDVGGVLLVGAGPSVTIDGETMLRLALEDGGLRLSLTVYGENDELLADIVDNEWIAGDPSAWDMEAGWQYLKLNVGPRRVALRLDARGQPLRLCAELWRHGIHVRLRPSGIDLPRNGTGISDLGLVNLPLAVNTTTGLTIGGAGVGYFISHPDPIQRLVQSLEALNSLTTGKSSVIVLPKAP